MTRTSFGTHPYLLGFDRLDRLAERAVAADGYPPCNIEQHGADSLRITLAVAGFTEKMLSVTVEDNQLLVRGHQDREAAEKRQFLHQGIAARTFQRSFVLAEGLEVTGASLGNGLLTIDLLRNTPEQIVQTIPISRK